MEISLQVRAKDQHTHGWRARLASTSEENLYSTESEQTAKDRDPSMDHDQDSVNEFDD